MGLRVAAVDVAEEELALARTSGAKVTVNALSLNAAAQVVEQTKGAGHGVLVWCPLPMLLLAHAAFIIFAMLRLRITLLTYNIFTH